MDKQYCLTEYWIAVSMGIEHVLQSPIWRHQRGQYLASVPTHKASHINPVEELKVHLPK